MIEEDEEEEDQHDPSRTDAQNIYASIAARHVGTQIPKSQEPDIQLGKGRLQESIQGPEYIHGYSKPLSDPTANFHPASRDTLPPLEPDGFISISRLPQSNQGSQDGDN